MKVNLTHYITFSAKDLLADGQPIMYFRRGPLRGEPTQFFPRVTGFELRPQMMSMNHKEHFGPLLGTLPLSHMGVASRAHFWENFVSQKLKEIAQF